MHRIVCSMLSKLNDFIMKNTTPSSTGSTVVHRARRPSVSTSRMNSRLQASGSAICVAAKNASFQRPQQPTSRNMAESSMNMTDACTSALLRSV